MNTMRPLIVTLAVAAGCAGAIWIITQPPSGSQPPERDLTPTISGPEKVTSLTPPAVIPEETVSVVIPEAPAVVETTAPVAIPRPSESPKKIAEVRSQGPGAPALPRAKKERLDPVARVALSWVGADPDAEEYWIDAINDARLSGHERSDLIEDLNEEGFPDPKNPTFDDLPLIVNRLQLIDELAPDAMDEVNWDAFVEAKKDLVNMALRAMQ